MSSEPRSLGHIDHCQVVEDAVFIAALAADAPLFDNPETLRWRGATPAFAAWADRMKALRLLERCEKAAGR